MVDTSFLSWTGWTALVSFVTSGIVSGGLQVVLKARFDRTLAENAAAIGRKNTEEMARITTDLARDSARELERFKQRFAQLATHQTEAAIALAERLAAVDLAARRLLMPGSPSSMAGSLYETCETARFAATEFIEAKRLLFPPDIGDLADSIIRRVAEGESAKHVWMMADPPTAQARALVIAAWTDQAGPGAAALTTMHDRLRDLLQGSLG